MTSVRLENSCLLAQECFELLKVKFPPVSDLTVSNNGNNVIYSCTSYHELVHQYSSSRRFFITRGWNPEIQYPSYFVWTSKFVVRT